MSYPLALSKAEIEYQISRLKDNHRYILSRLVLGESNQEIAAREGLTVAGLNQRIYSACDRAGCLNRAQLIALYSVWLWHELHTEYRAKSLESEAPSS